MRDATRQSDERTAGAVASVIVQFFGFIAIGKGHFVLNREARESRQEISKTFAFFAVFAVQIFPNARNTRSGVNGNSSIHTPVASWMAAAMAGATGR